ncbi:Asp-tRNA(Asn)/Glu-tRNA(Gln) amidotransferase subunit GatC [Candidatus Kuenenbacteria bacterium]|nr:Asp-tRNA(Asn)/Glu-tRNA(Gln) amidotransferase subunit GatC [Candidatus Kuenenbacteria bacterium]
MAISKERIEHLANLARLDITEKEKEKYAEQISSILDYFEQLKELDTEGVEPMSHVFDLQNIDREDKVKQIWSQDKVLAEAPELEKRQIKVKGVFMGNT